MFPEGSVAVVTGLGPGMGRSIALGFARHGVDVVLGARRVERVQAVADEVRALGRDPLVIQTDIAEERSCRRIVDAAVERFGGIDILVQNGHHEGDWKAVADADPVDWRRVFDVNFFSALYLIQAVTPVMTARGGGSITLVNSGAALRVPQTMGAYATSKAALATLARTAAVELGPKQIRVNGIYLGPVEGENLTSRVQGDADAWMQEKAKEMPLQTIPTPDQCAGAVLFMASELAAAVTGQHLSVNGGQWTT